MLYNLGVILWGAFVRATGSGAGCGSHWPLCNGEVVPRAPELETLIELTHRVTSGVALILVVALFVWSRRAFPAGHTVRRWAWLSLVLIIVEALLGAGLVLFELVAEDASSFRALAMVAHLINTFFLVAALSLTAWSGSGGTFVPAREKPAAMTLVLPAIVGILVVGATGAIAALGDTLFPAESLSDGLRDSFSRDSHPLVQLRKYHPLLAIVVGLYIVGIARFLARQRPSATLTRLAGLAGGLYIAQILLGIVNIVLLAPVSIQLVHLLLADAVWIALVLLVAATPADPPPSSRPDRAQPGRSMGVRAHP